MTGHRRSLFDQATAVACVLCPATAPVTGERHPSSVCPVRLPLGWVYSLNVLHSGEHSADGFPLYDCEEIFTCPECLQRAAAQLSPLFPTTEKPS